MTEKEARDYGLARGYWLGRFCETPETGFATSQSSEPEALWSAYEAGLAEGISQGTRRRLLEQRRQTQRQLAETRQTLQELADAEKKSEKKSWKDCQCK